MADVATVRKSVEALRQALQLLLGVGLGVVKLLVEQSGGSLTVDSGEGQGTTFVVVLPRYDVADYLT